MILKYNLQSCDVLMFANDFYSIVIPHLMRNLGFPVKVKIPKKIEVKKLRAVHPGFIVRDTG